MEVGEEPRRRRHFAPRIERDPAHELSRCRTVWASIAPIDGAGRNAEIAQQLIHLVNDRLAAAHEVAHHFAIDLAYQRRIWLEAEVIAREIVGEELAILEDGIDRLAEKAGVGA